GSFYVPAFSSIRMEAGKTRLDLAVTLSIHNPSESMPLVLSRIDYFDTAGTLVQRHLLQAIALKPLGAIEIFVSRDDLRGGLGANHEQRRLESRMVHDVENRGHLPERRVEADEESDQSEMTDRRICKEPF